MYIRIGIFKKLVQEVWIGQSGTIWINNTFEITRNGMKNGMEDIREIQLNGEYYTVEDYDKIKEILEKL